MKPAAVWAAPEEMALFGKAAAQFYNFCRLHKGIRHIPCLNGLVDFSIIIKQTCRKKITETYCGKL